MKIHIHENIKPCTDHCRLGYIVIRNVKVQGVPPFLAQKLFQLQTALAAVYHIDGLANLQKLAGVRSVYNQHTFDTTRYTLEVEGLVRSVLQSKDAYYVNSAVAAINYCSLKFLLPASLYDLDQISGDVMYGLPVEGSYVNINGDIMDTDCQPFLSDSRGVFGNSTTHSRRTAVTLSTKNILVVIYADEKITNDALMQRLNFTSKRIIHYNGGTIEAQDIIES